MVYPVTIFGISGALSGRLTTDTSPCALDILARVPQVGLYVWINLLVEVLANQRLPSSITEDAINKPWRPLPSHRLTPAEARSGLLCLLPLMIAMAFFYRCEKESLLLAALSWMYNDLGGADANFVVRNMLNAGGLLCFGAGATIVASGSYTLIRTAHLWFGLLGAVIFLTVHTQDLADMKGDAARGRRTLPLVYGENVARWSVAIAVAVSSPACSAFWHLGLYRFLLPAVLGFLLGYRITFLRGEAADKGTWKLWCMWISLLYMLPLLKDHGPLVST